MENIKFYEVNEAYINYLLPYAPHLFHNSKKNQKNARKYIGIILCVNNMNYFAPLSSFKPKHEKMKEGIDFLKVRKYAVINLNNMFPVPDNEFQYIDFETVKDKVYKDLLLSEYRIIKQMQNKIRKRAKQIYQHKITKGNETPLAKRCNDFVSLEKLCKEFEAMEK